MGLVALTCVCVFKSGLSTLIRVSLIVAPDRGDGSTDPGGRQRAVLTEAALRQWEGVEEWGKSLTGAR